ncbi:MAG: aryl-sulfate sulfotransferase [Erysipelotrichaceae bacterium]
MNRKYRNLLLISLSLVLLMVTIYYSGLLVKPNFLTVSNLTEVESYDVLSWQAQRETDILSDYSQGSYMMANPYIIVDPYNQNPLSALVIFNADDAEEYTVTVVSEHAYASVVSSVSKESGRVELAIIGLYAGINNTILIQSTKQVVELHILTESLPQDFQTYQLITSKPEKMEPGFTLFSACFNHSYTALLDQDGAVRAYFSNTEMAHGTSIITLKNGHLLATGDETKQVPYNMTSLWEFNWLGKIYQEYEIPNGVHHDISELPNGDILAVSNNKNMFETGTREDVTIIIDHSSGIVKKEYDFRMILDEHRTPFNNFHPDILNVLNIDWMHTNAAIYDETNNWLIVSSPTQSEVVAIDVDTNQIQWILGPHEGYDGSSAYLAQYLLTPKGANFEWQWAQHHPMILPDFDHDPDTMDLLMLDNGQAKSFYEESSVLPQDNYSRAVHYRIHLTDRTVEQIWEYGKERGNELYSTFLGDANYLPTTENVLITFGGQLKQDGITVDKIVEGVLGNIIIHSTVVEVSKTSEVVYEVKVLNNEFTTSAETYQATRVNLSSLTPVSMLTSNNGIRLSNPIFLDQDTQTNIPNIYLGDLSATFNNLKNENQRLIVDGNLFYQGKTYLLGQAVIVLRSFTKTYAFKSNSGLNGRFFSSIDLTQLEKGTYEISIAAGVREGNNVLEGITHKGYFKTAYKLTINE